MSQSTDLPAPRPLDGLADDHPLPSSSKRRHPAVRVLVFLVVFIALSVAGSLAVMSSTPVDFPPISRQGALLSLVQLVASVAAYAAMCAVEGRRRPLEWDPARIGGLAKGLALGTIVCLVVFLLAWALQARTVAGFNPGYSPWLAIWQVGIAAGISEEILFRGFLFRFAEATLGTWGAVALSAIIFGGVHMTNPNATAWGSAAIALEAGVMFGLLYVRTRSLWMLAGVHAAWNVVQGPVLGSAISGATNNGDGWLRSFPAGNELLSGGVFGLEASLLSVLCWTVLSLWLARGVIRDHQSVLPIWVRRRRAGINSSRPAGLES